MALSGKQKNNPDAVPSFPIIQRIMFLWAMVPEISGYYLHIDPDSKKAPLPIMAITKRLFDYLINAADALEQGNNYIMAKLILKELIDYLHEQLSKTDHPNIQDIVNKEIKLFIDNLNKISNALAFELQKPYKITIPDIPNLEAALVEIKRQARDLKQSNIPDQLNFNAHVTTYTKEPYEKRYFTLAFEKVRHVLTKWPHDEKSTAQNGLAMLKYQLEQLSMKVPYELRSAAELIITANLMAEDPAYIDEFKLIFTQLVMHAKEDFSTYFQSLPKSGLFQSGDQRNNVAACIVILNNTHDQLKADAPLTLVRITDMSARLKTHKLDQVKDEKASNTMNNLIQSLDKLATQLIADEKSQLKKTVKGLC